MALAPEGSKHPDPGRPAPPAPRFATEVAWILALTAIGTSLRLAWFSGFGLGDDVLFRHDIYSILTTGRVLPDNMAYRFTWWLPTVFSCRLLGLGEVPILLPILAATTLAIPITYALGSTLFGPVGGRIAAALLVVTPLDFAWSTMLSMDILLSVFLALTMLFTLRATVDPRPAGRRRQLGLAALCLWFAFHAKVSAVLVGPVLLLTWWRHRGALARDLDAFLVPAAALFGGTALVCYVLRGDPIAPYTMEVTAQGLRGKVALEFHRLTSAVFWQYPNWLFRPNRYGELFFSVYPQLAVLFALTARFTGLRTAPEMWWWLLIPFLGMQLNVQRTEGEWVAGFRNIRHIHLLVYPLALVLAGYLASLARRAPAPTAAAVAVLLGLGLWQSTSVASKTRVSFADRRQAVALLVTLPKKPVYSDFQIPTWFSIIEHEHPGWTFKNVHSFDPEVRRSELAAVDSGYLVSGGGRDPWYGCIDCIPRAAEVDPQQWRLVREWPDPIGPTVWRPEPLRLWERGPAPPDGSVGAPPAGS